MIVWCVGAGSIGMLFAGKLAALGDGRLRTVLIARTAEQARKLESEGLVVREKEGRLETGVFALSYEDAFVAKRAPAPDWMLIAVKQRHLTDDFVRAVADAMDERTKLICLQNGIGHVERLAVRVPLNRIYLAVTTEGAKKLSDREVAHTGTGTTWVGPAENGDTVRARPDSPEKRLAGLLNEAGFHTLLSNSMKEIVWHKLLVNSVINPLTAVLGVPNGRLIESEHLLRLMRRLADEAVALARTVGVSVRDDFWDQLTAVCRNTATNDSSMLQDVRQGRETEIEWINGAMLRIAGTCGVSMPTHRTVYDMVKALEQGGRGWK